ncbi:MAG: NF038120 family PEP-CTERM protein [Pseudomonadota bacterium]
MKYCFRHVAAVVAIALSAGIAQAEVITFEQPVNGPTTPFAPFLTHGDEFLQGSYYFDPFSNASNAQFGDLVGSMINGSDLAACFSVLCPSNNPSTFFGSVNDGALAFGRVDGNSFSVTGFDASFMGASGNVLPAVSGLLRLQGFTSTGATMFQTYQLAGPNEAGALGFGNYQTSGAFASTQFATVYAFGFACDASGTCNAFTNNRAQFALDNISVSAVPEAETTAMFLLGLTAMGAVVRRRRRQQSV